MDAEFKRRTTFVVTVCAGVTMAVMLVWFYSALDTYERRYRAGVSPRHVQYTCNESSNSEFLEFCASFRINKLSRISRDRQSESLSLRH